MFSRAGFRSISPPIELHNSFFALSLPSLGMPARRTYSLVGLVGKIVLLNGYHLSFIYRYGRYTNILESNILLMGPGGRNRDFSFFLCLELL